MDDNYSGTLDFNEWMKAIKDYRVDLDEKTAKEMFIYFDRDKTGQIDYDEFLR